MWLIIVFFLGYLFITLEHIIQVDKAASALLTAVMLWSLLIIGAEEPETANLQFDLMDHLGDIAAILFFLLGAMTIVELVDSHKGFDIIIAKIQATHKVKLLWLLSTVTFFLSAVLDNLTTTIVMIALLKKLVEGKENQWFFASFIVIAANAGGAWSPLGDVTTIMLWIGGQITAASIIFKVFLPSVACLIAPLSLVSFYLKGSMPRPDGREVGKAVEVNAFEKQLMLTLGVGALLFVPFFKNITHLPPFMGILFGLSILWLISEVLHRKKGPELRSYLSVAATIRRIDTPSVLFFLGILLAVAALQTAGHLASMAIWLDQAFADIYLINTLIGLLSAVIDNVPLVAGAMGMYSLDHFRPDHQFWTLLAYCAGTGGSVLIIGSAAGIAAMGILKIDFIWYLKKISWLALIGYLAGIGVYLLLQ